MDDLLWAKDFYWAHREAFRAGAAITTIALVNVSLLVWTARRLQELSLVRERVSRLADGLALLTDTTEAGLATLIKEVEQLGGRRKSSSKSLEPLERRQARDRGGREGREGRRDRDDGRFV